jgi:ADP-ribosylglycohydrolase
VAKYFVQSMSSGRLTKVTYYRKQSAHPTHAESGAFTAAAITAYANNNDIEESAVEKGPFKSNQGIPAGGTTEEI